MLRIQSEVGVCQDWWRNCTLFCLLLIIYQEQSTFLVWDYMFTCLSLDWYIRCLSFAFKIIPSIYRLTGNLVVFSLLVFSTKQSSVISPCPHFSNKLQPGYTLTMCRITLAGLVERNTQQFPRTAGVARLTTSWLIKEFTRDCAI